MTKLEPLRESPDRGTISPFQPLDLEQHQILLWFHANCAGAALSRAKKATNVIAEISESPVVY